MSSHGRPRGSRSPAGGRLALAPALAGVGLALFGLYTGEGLLATGVYNDDDIGHYLIARDAPARPELFLNVWGRPLFTLAYAIPAQFGFPAVRIVTAAVMAAAAVVTGLAASKLGVPAALGAALFGT